MVFKQSSIPSIWISRSIFIHFISPAFCCCRRRSLLLANARLIRTLSAIISALSSQLDNFTTSFPPPIQFLPVLPCLQVQPPVPLGSNVTGPPRVVEQAKASERLPADVVHVSRRSAHPLNEDLCSPGPAAHINHSESTFLPGRPSRRADSSPSSSSSSPVSPHLFYFTADPLSNSRLTPYTSRIVVSIQTTSLLLSRALPYPHAVPRKTPSVRRVPFAGSSPPHSAITGRRSSSEGCAKSTTDEGRS